MRAPVELKRAASLVNHGPTTLVTSAHGGRRNVMAAAWVMALDFNPPKVAAVIAQDTFTRELVEASGELVLNLPTRAMVDATYAVGHASGRDVDKFQKYGLATAAASKVQAPLVEGCVGWLECRVVKEPELASKYDLFVLEVVAAWADDRVWNGRTWTFTDDQLRTVHHLTKGEFVVSGAAVSAKT